MTITEKVSYLKGLVDGSELDLTTKEGKILSSVMGILEELALTVVDLEDEITDLSEQVDEVDESLADLEDFVYEDGSDEDYDLEAECPACGEEFLVSDEDIADDGLIICPECGEKFEIELDEEDSCCGEDCDCNDDKE